VPDDQLYRAGIAYEAEVYDEPEVASAKTPMKQDASA
jgi:hypothetical protein